MSQPNAKVVKSHDFARQLIAQPDLPLVVAFPTSIPGSSPHVRFVQGLERVGSAYIIIRAEVASL